MTNTNTATDEQLSTIRARAYNDTARDMQRDGVWLSHEQADDLGKEAIGWINGRLGLNVEENDSCVACTPPKHYTGETSRAAGLETQDEE